MTELEPKRQRERVVRQAMASSALEGLIAAKALQENLISYVEGTTTLEQILTAAQARHAPKSPEKTNRK